MFGPKIEDARSKIAIFYPLSSILKGVLPVSLFQQPARVFSALLRPYLRHLAKPSLPRYRGELALRGLEKQVSVFWQSEGIPHVFAANEQDLFFAQGYLHAQERLWQMDFNRRFLSGRLAEILGQFAVPWQELTSQFRGCDSVDADYFMRLIGIRRAALASAGMLSEEDRRRLEAYSDGVNRFIEQCGKRLPLEFRLLHYVPDPWRPEDTLTIGKGFAFLLSLPLFTRLNAIAVAAKLAGEPEKLYDLYPLGYDGNFHDYSRYVGFDAAPLAFCRRHARRKRLLPRGARQQRLGDWPEPFRCWLRDSVQRSAPAHDGAIGLVLDAFES